MSPLQHVLMLQRMSRVQEENFWHGQDVAVKEELEMGPPPPSVQLEKVGQQVP